MQDYVLENKPLNRICQSKRNENREWRKLQKENVIFPTSSCLVKLVISIRLTWAGHVAAIKYSRTALKMLKGKTVGGQYYNQGQAKKFY